MPRASVPTRLRHSTRLPTAAATTRSARPARRLALATTGVTSAVRSSASTRRIASSPFSMAARASAVSKARCLCQGTPPTSSALQPGGGGARLGSDSCSICCRSLADSRRSALSVTGDGGGGAYLGGLRGCGPSGAPDMATCLGSRPPAGILTSIPAAGRRHSSQPGPRRSTHSAHAASNSVSSGGSSRHTSEPGPAYARQFAHTRRTSAASVLAAAVSSPQSPKPYAPSASASPMVRRSIGGPTRPT
eukprot:scaffold141310_cov21-Tisochrysis_lutea.AAC.3